MYPTGKGIFIWRLEICASGDMNLLACMAHAAGFSWVAIKAADGKDNYNQGDNPWYGPDLLRSAISELRSEGIQVYLWQYIYGANYLRQSIAAFEAETACQNIGRFRPDGWIIDPEKEFKRSGSAAWADQYMTILSRTWPDLPIGICSYRFPTLHPEIPWQSFLRRSTFHCPQVYWILAHNPGDQLRRSVRELQALAKLPVIPVGSAYYDPGYKWQPTRSEIDELDQAAHVLDLPGITWWEWGENGHGVQFISDFWSAIAAHNWGDAVIPPQAWNHAITQWARSMGYVGPDPG